jgi:glycosyltransferase involved in cell wall biosynthesis
MTTGTLWDYWGEGPQYERDEHGALKQVAFREGEAAEHPLGVLFHAPWETVADGWCESSRRHARALAMTGCPVHLRSVSPSMPSWMGRGAAKDPEGEAMQDALSDVLGASIGRYSARVLHVVHTDALLTNLTTHRHLSYEEMAARNKATVLSLMWERSTVSEAAKAAMKRVGQVWVACRANVEMLASHGIDRDKIRVTPVPYFPNDPHLRLRGRKRTPGPARFYHIGKWEPRKAQDQIVLAFLRAFEPGREVLWLKSAPFATALDGYPQGPRPAVVQALDDAEVKKNGWTRQNVSDNVKVVEQRLPADKLVKMHQMCDVYLSLSRAEGFDMPAFDAKLAGNLMVYTPSGGPQDFCSARDVVVPVTGAVSCHPWYRWEPGATYGNWRIDDAVAAMRQAARRVEAGDARDEHDLSWFEVARTGERMASYLREMVEPLGVKLYERRAS